MRLYLTHGYLDPSIGLGGDYSATTDGFALGITMLVVLTGRSPLNINRRARRSWRRTLRTLTPRRLLTRPPSGRCASRARSRMFGADGAYWPVPPEERKRLAISECAHGADAASART